MKKIQDNKIYVDLEDLIYLGISSNILDRIKKGELKLINKSVVFSSPEEIDFFKRRDDILDYDYITSLTPEELEKELIKNEEMIFYYENQFFNLTIFNNNSLVEKDKKRKQILKKLYYKRNTLTNYLKDKNPIQRVLKK